MRPPGLMIVQGGGPTAVFNRTLAAILTEANASSLNSIFGASYGVRGLVRGDVVDLSHVSKAQLATLRRTPGAALGSSRYCPSDDEMDALVSNLRSLNIRMLLFMGGNGTMRGAHLIAERCRDHKWDIKIVGVPKTIDNDLSSTDRAPGYASAAHYIASATRELGADIRSLPQPVTVLETMGRNVGWVAAASLFARSVLSNYSDCPQLICIPEVPFVEEQFIDNLQQILRLTGWAVVVVAEGLRYADGSLVYQLADPGQADPLMRPMTGGVAQHLAGIIGHRLRIRCRSEKPGLLGRNAMACTSPQDREDADAVGRAAVRALLQGASDVMVSLAPLAPGRSSQTSLVPLVEAGAGERTIPREWLTDGPVPVNENFINYVRPLIGSLDEHITELGAPLPAEEPHND